MVHQGQNIYHKFIDVVMIANTVYQIMHRDKTFITGLVDGAVADTVYQIKYSSSCKIVLQWLGRQFYFLVISYTYWAY